MTEAVACLTEANAPVDLDAIWLGDIGDREFVVALFRASYPCEGSKDLLSPDELSCIEIVQQLFAFTTALPPRLAAQMGDISSRVRDGYRPRVCFYWCSEDPPSSMPAPLVIETDSGQWPASFVHIDYGALMRLRLALDPIRDTVRFSGKMLLEEFDCSRVALGKLRVGDLQRLLRTHGPSLFEPSLRRPLPFCDEEIIEWVYQLLKSPKERGNFALYSEGVVLLCDHFDVRPRTASVAAIGIRALPGSPASNALWRILADPHRAWDPDELEDAYVWAKIIQAPSHEPDLQRKIVSTAQRRRLPTRGPWQADDDYLAALMLSLRAVGYELHPHRRLPLLDPMDIDLEEAAQAVLAVWRRAPHLAARWSRALTADDRDEIFQRLKGAQIALAVRLVRLADVHRLQPPAGAPPLVQYASSFAAMLMGERLLADLGTDVEGLGAAFDAAQVLVDVQGDRYFEEALQRLQQGLLGLYGEAPVSLERLAATFRRGDLLEVLGRVGEAPRGAHGGHLANASGSAGSPRAPLAS